MRKREVWIDYLKATACILVALGHFLQSMIKSNVITGNHFFTWFEETIYLFHVPLFFICSGYIFQQYSCVNSIKSWISNIKNKILALGVPYFTFSLITWVLKTIFSNSVNDQPGSLADALFLHPLSPYWFLYVLFFIFLITPTFKETRYAVFALIISLMLYILRNHYPVNSYLISRLTTYEFYFILGIFLSILRISNFKILECHGKHIGNVLFVAFLPLSIIHYLHFSSYLTSFFLCLLICLALICIFIYCDTHSIQIGFLNLISKYSMPIFLMHTIFAATLRSVLFKLHISNPSIHIMSGLLISFVGPIIATMIMKKNKYIYFFLYPNKLIKSKNSFN